jgi:DNA modification methylase
MQQFVINGNNIDLLKNYPDNYFDAIVTDPPYGLGKEPNAEEVMRGWIEKGYHEIGGSGFMGKEWDAFIPQPIFWKEVFRVLKHGGHVISFFGTRTYDWGVMAMRFAGFEVRDCIQWLYGCLSDDTEILTRSGYIQYHKFIKLPNFREQDILIYDIEKDIYKWEKPERWNHYNIHKDKCYRIKSDNTDQIVSRNHRCLVEREGKLVFIQAEMLSEMEYMPTLSDDLSFIQEGYSEILHKKMQWTLSGSRLEETRTQGKGCMVGRNERELSVIANRRKEPILEGRNNLSEKERVLFGSEIEVCKMPKGVYSNGEERWVRSGISVGDGETIEQTSIENGMRTSYRPQPNEQQYNESNAICNEQGTQTIRMGRSYSTTLSTITPIEYSGVIFCPTVSTGCFVARRNGKIFITGNSGFPKSHNISKAIDKIHGAEREVLGEKVRGDVQKAKQNGSGYLSDYANRNNEKQFGYGTELITTPSTEEAKQWDGWGSALKPANEPIVLARKPLEKGLSIAENVIKWGTGGINIDGCRVGNKTKTNGGSPNINDSWIGANKGYVNGVESAIHNYGRFPANLILTHHPECECKGLKKVKGMIDKPTNRTETGNTWDEENSVLRKNMPKNSGGFADENGDETIEDWDCHEYCPIRKMDEQSGILKSGAMDSITKGGKFNVYGEMAERRVVNPPSEGGASRFFYCAKASKSERNKGLDNTFEKELGHNRFDKCEICNGYIFQNQDRPSACKCESPKRKNNIVNGNFHPTVKPVKLMQYLVRLITPPNGKVLDPFCGSGTTGIACKLEGFEFIGLEQDAEYSKIAQSRIDNYEEEIEEIVYITNKEGDKVQITQTSLF